jgi:hypothetical protein
LHPQAAGILEEPSSDRRQEVGMYAFRSNLDCSMDLDVHIVDRIVARMELVLSYLIATGIDISF